MNACRGGSPTCGSSSRVIRESHVGFLRVFCPCASAVCRLSAQPLALLTWVLSSQTPETSCDIYRRGQRDSVVTRDLWSSQAEVEQEERDPPERDVERESRYRTTEGLRVPAFSDRGALTARTVPEPRANATCFEALRLQGGSDTSEWRWRRDGTMNGTSRDLRSDHCRWPLDHAEGRAEVSRAASGDGN